MIELMLQAERALLVGMVDQAERLYQTAATNDPRNAIAVVGLARIALERNDDRAAYDLSRRALAIDPENAAALRLEARLSEVLTHRGEGVERPAFVHPHGRDNGPGPATGGVRQTERPGWQPAKMPAEAPPSRPQPSNSNIPASSSANPASPRRSSLFRRLLGR